MKHNQIKDKYCTTRYENFAELSLTVTVKALM